MPDFFSRNNAKDTRSKDEKLEAMANQTESPHEAEIAKKHILLRKEKQKQQTINYHGTPNMNSWRDTDSSGRPVSRRPVTQMKPHVYKAYNGSDAQGCESCARSKDNPAANHIKAIT